MAQFLLFAVWNLAAFYIPSVTPNCGTAAEPPGNDAYHRIVGAYLDGKWDELDLALLAAADRIAALPAMQQDDVAYIRAAREECHPPWWNLCKAGNKIAFRPNVWGKTLSVTYVPDGQRGVQAQYHNADAAFTVTWPAAEMDNLTVFDRGFTKADANAAEVWTSLGTARVWSQTSGRLLAGMGEKEKLRMSRRQDFRSNLTALYYGSPKSRRWSLLVDLLTWSEKEYAELPVAGSRKAIGAMFLAEVLVNPAKYPSLPLPKSLDAVGAEETLARHYRRVIDRQSWTLAEDRSLREAIKKLAAANDANVYQTERVTLANKLAVSVDPAADGPLSEKRDAWLKERFDAVTSK
jgi:hypothetical protein